MSCINRTGSDRCDTGDGTNRLDIPLRGDPETVCLDR